MITNPHTDLVLIQAAQQGDQQAFRQLISRYEQQVAATVVGMLGNGQDAEDVGQEVFIRFYRTLDQFRGESSLGTYLTRIAINLSLNQLKKRKRNQRFRFFGKQSEEGPELQVPDQGLSQEQRETQAFVQTGLQQLAPEFRSVVVLRLLEGYSTQETAEILDIKPGTVLSRLSRAQAKLREILKSLDTA
ncbi:RNA polymerase sigma factor [Pontibacter sp. G13]|uniref:RNA polymerase sigma factor n=1 Tax=Pontibacter sp. G13 TaxID=3074898 RepID=UPI00288B3074|nr:RNA polymerase sigma factor [Pontibacter sp. G13]WNJ19383.1 RNA polymerase sigma factor [Pontibacter sp. G13]